MRYIQIKCVNQKCPHVDDAVTIPEGQHVAPGIIQPYSGLVCEYCRHEVEVKSLEHGGD